MPNLPARINKAAVKSVAWVERIDLDLLVADFYDDMSSTIKHYQEEHGFNIHAAGHAAISVIGKEVYRKIRMRLLSKGIDVTPEDFLAHLRRWFDHEGYRRFVTEE